MGETADAITKHKITVAYKEAVKKIDVAKEKVYVASKAKQTVSTRNKADRLTFTKAGDRISAALTAYKTTDKAQVRNKIMNAKLEASKAIISVYSVLIVLNLKRIVCNLVSNQ